MSIFRETFPQFIQNELNRRQAGMAVRDPRFIQQLNTRAAWIRLSSGVNYEGTSKLAKQYVLQGGTLFDKALRSGLGSNGSGTYDTFSPGGNPHRLGIRPMPGITNVSIQSKGAYGSLQEATVSFNCWDIRQLEELEILYMRPGYTVLLEFGWDYSKNYFGGILPSYNILDREQGLTSINEAFKEIYEKIEKSNGTYDALLGYVKNYNWTARDDGGYDCTTTIISLGEVLESLKCNWIPMATKAFDESGAGLLGKNLPKDNPDIITSYEQGIIPGLLHELWDWMSKSNNKGNFSNEFIDTQFNNTRYKMFMSHTMGAAAKEDRGGFPKPLGADNSKIEGWITLGSFCDLLNNYVLLKNEKNNPISLITAYETNAKGEFIAEGNSFKSLECIASPLSLSTNLGVCLVRNDNWDKLVITQAEEEKKVDQNTTTTPPQRIAPDIASAVQFKNFIGVNRFSNLIKRTNNIWTYSGRSLKDDIEAFVNELQVYFKDFDVPKPDDIQVLLTNGQKFPLTKSLIPGAGTETEVKKKLTNLNWLEYFNPAEVSGFSPEEKAVDLNRRIEKTYEDLFLRDYVGGFLNDDPFEEAEGGVFDGNGKAWSKKDVLSLIKNAFTNAPLNADNLQKLQNKIPEAAASVAEQAANTPGISGLTIEFLTKDSGPQTGDIIPKSLGKIANIYVNINFLYSQAISRNVASSDNQNTNNISIREYMQGILREVQNSLGNINQFDIQVDERTAIGRIIDINFTGDPNKTNLFEIQLHNTNSVARNYNFQSKIFPEMGSIIAISAQDATGIGKLGYDNATLVAWNEGISDRLIPKKDFSSTIKLANESEATTFLLPFLTKIYSYFQALNGSDKSNINYAFGGLNFAYRDFLANLNRYDKRNNFKTIIPTELSITLDGIGGIVIGNLFSINQEIIPKGYKGLKDRQLAYIVTRLSHNLQDNDWTTELSAYPIIFENSSADNITKKWKNQKYPGALGFSISIGDRQFAFVSTSKANPNNLKDTVNFFLSKGYKDFQVAALVGGFIAESNVNPTIQNSIGATGLAQWLGGRKQALLSKPDPFSLNTQLNFVIEEFNNKEAQAGKKLKNSTTLEEAIAAAAAYERFEGITKGANTTFADVVVAEGEANRIGYARDLLQRIQSGEFSSSSSSPSTQAATETQKIKIIAQRIKNATSGAGTNNVELTSAIREIKNVNMFREVNKIINIQNTLNEELGLADAFTAGVIRDLLKAIGVKMEFQTSQLGVVSNIKITYN